MSFATVLMPAMTVVGVGLNTTFKDGACYTAIPALWADVYQKNIMASIPGRIDRNVLLGLYADYTPDFSLTSGQYSFTICAQVADDVTVPAGMVVKKIPVSRYAVFTAKGPFATAISKAWMEIWQNKDLQRTFTGDFEWYDKNSTNDENSIVKIYIAIK